MHCPACLRIRSLLTNTSPLLNVCIVTKTSVSLSNKRLLFICNVGIDVLETVQYEPCLVYGCHLKCTILGVRSLANASRARQFNPLNPLGWGGSILFKVRASIRTCVPNLGAVHRERFLTIDNPLNPLGVGWVKFLIFLR